MIRNYSNTIFRTLQITVTGLLKIEISYEKQEDKTLKTLGFSVQTNLSSS